MATTRDFKSLGEFAVNANEIDTPGVGERLNTESYRNTVFTNLQQRRGKQFGVVPVSENVNQQIFNQTQFTDLIDPQGIPGWTLDVTYAASAIVFGSDGRLYLSKRDNNKNIDPFEDDYASDWWTFFESGTELAAKFADQTEGQEGARLVGTTAIIPETNNQVTGGVLFGVSPNRLVGATLKDNLDRNTSLFNQMENVEILAAIGNESIDIDFDFPTKILSQSTDIFNVTSIDTTLYSKMAAQTGGFTSDRIGYLTVNFTNPIPTPYLYELTINTGVGGGLPGFPSEGEKAFGVTREYYASTTSSVANLTANSIDIGNLELSRLPETSNIFWPASWANENPETRIFWVINLFCYRIV